LADVRRAPHRPALPHARLARPQAGALRAGQRRHRRGSAVEGGGQGLRVRQGQLRRAGGIGHQGRRAGEPRDGGGGDLHRRDRDRPALLREAVHPGPGQESREGLRAAARDPAQQRPRRHRAGGDPHPRIPGRGAAAGRCADPDAAALSAGTGGSGRAQAAGGFGLRLPDQRQGTADGRAADRLDERQVDPGRLPRRVPRAAAGHHPQADQERRRHHPGGRRAGRAGGDHHQRGRLHVPTGAEPQGQEAHPGEEGFAGQGGPGEEGGAQVHRQEGREEGPGAAQGRLSRPYLPEVTSCAGTIASAPGRTEHAPMRRMLEPLLRPLPLAGLLTILTVGYALRFATPEQQPLALALLGAFLLLFLALQLLPEHWRRSRDLVLVAMAPVILALGGLSYRVNASQVLLVIWVACMFLAWPARTCLAAAAVANIAFCIALRRAGFQEPEPMVLINMGFQALAAICVHYATSAERSRDALARVNADLLATRALLADSARDAERLRMARELHDVAGHKLTAMRLNLRSLLADPQLAGRHELAVAERLSGELMADIRQVVQSLRDDRGL